MTDLPQMSNLQQTFKKEPYTKKVALAAALAAIIATFLPWMSVSFGTFAAVSANGWHSFGYLTVLGSIAYILLWLLPKVGVKFALPLKEDLLQKILAIAILAGPVLWLLDSSFEFSVIGFGLYIALAAGAVTTYFSFIGGKAGSTHTPATPPSTPQTPPEAKK